MERRTDAQIELDLKAEIDACTNCDLPRPKCDGSDQGCLFFQISLDPEIIRRRRLKEERGVSKREVMEFVREKL